MALVCSENFRWTPARIKAAELIANESISDSEIAERAGVTGKTINNWKREPLFSEKVYAIIAEQERIVLNRGIAKRVKRIERCSQTWESAKRLIAERAADPKMQGVPGGTTGLLVHQLKGIGKGDDYQVVDEYAVDTGLLREMRELEKQVATELGQWTEKVESKVTQESNVNVEHRHTIDLESMPLELKRQLLQYVRQANQPAGAPEPPRIVENEASDTNEPTPDSDSGVDPSDNQADYDSMSV